MVLILKGHIKTSFEQSSIFIWFLKYYIKYIVILSRNHILRDA